ncbi:hypothetical protein A2Z67_05045 [Candidatus Woesebacteria bacterium RBG_13_36_22]|uniref:Uncharacterized protein n=1 Tax=Candidatus Woesebacteria bacterium RBG_13_36_22 TaxID=1802478 RepID=A0A1F7X4I4_9BACT|nr:MAG: hypothetical protein A2Z67_05045 [Candidatus Woesebacteria bacterium RBG_13_36_22]
MNPQQRMKVLRKAGTPTLRKRLDRIGRALRGAEDRVNYLRNYERDIELILHEREIEKVRGGLIY